MSIFASKTQKTIPLPADPPNTITIRKLTGREVEFAQSEHLRGIVAGYSARGWAGTFQRQLDKGIATDATAKLVLADPLNGYDRFAIVKAGIVSWSYGKKVDGPIAVPLSELEDLDDETLELVACEVMKLTKPWLFETAAQSEATAKND